MSEVKFGMILEDACRLAGRDPYESAIPSGWKVLAAMTINAGIRDLVAEKFPMMMRFEFRRYRPTWDSATTYNVGHEVWHAGAYWRREASSAGSPGTGGWMKLEMNEVNAFVAWDQPWENTSMDPSGVDYTRFAYLADPRYNPNATPIPGCGMCEMGVLIPAPAPEGVFVRFVPRMSPVDFTDWSANTSYLAGDVAYDPATKDVYLAVDSVESGGMSPGADTSGVWHPIRIRREFQTYLTRLVAADLMTEDQGKYQTRAAADRELDILRDRYHDGNGSFKIRVGRFCR